MTAKIIKTSNLNEVPRVKKLILFACFSRSVLVNEKFKLTKLKSNEDSEVLKLLNSEKKTSILFLNNAKCPGGSRQLSCRKSV